MRNKARAYYCYVIENSFHEVQLLSAGKTYPTADAYGHHANSKDDKAIEFNQYTIQPIKEDNDMVFIYC